MDINDFYKRVLTSLDVIVEDDYLMIKDGDKRTNLRSNGTPLVLPTKTSIGSVLDEDEEGNIVTVKQLFNPLDETVIKGDSASLTKLKQLVEVRVGNKFLVVGSLLLSIAENKKHQTKTGMIINQFLMRLNEANNPGITKVVDSKTIDTLHKIYDASFKPRNTKFLKVYVKKGGKIGHNKFNRVTTFKYPIYEELCGLEKNGRINGVTLRNKDIAVFKILFEYLAEGINERGVVAVGSNDTESPGFISLFGLYLKTMTKVQEVVSGIKGVDAEWEDDAKMDIVVDYSELSDLGGYKRDLAKIPREGDVVKTKLRDAGTNVLMQDLNHEVVPQQPTLVTEDTSASAIKKALYGNVSGVNTLIHASAGNPGIPQGYPMSPPAGNPGMSHGYPMSPPAGNPGIPHGYPIQPAMGNPVTAGYRQPAVDIGAYGTTSAHGSGTSVPQPVQVTNGMWNR